MENNSVLNNQKTSFFKTINILSIITLTAAIIYTILNFKSLPEMVPIHTSFDGTFDSFVSGKIGVLMYSFIGMIGIAICIFFSKYPDKLSYKIELTEKNRAKQYSLASKFYAILALEVAITFSFIQFKITHALLTGANSIGSAYLIFSVIVVISLFIFRFLSKDCK